MKYLKYPCSVPNHLLANYCRAAVFQVWQRGDTLRTNPFLSRGMLGVPVVEWLNVVSVYV